MLAALVGHAFVCVIPLCLFLLLFLRPECASSSRCEVVKSSNSNAAMVDCKRELPDDKKGWNK